MRIIETLTNDMKSAMKAREPLRLSTIRLMINSIKNKEKDAGKELTEQEAGAVIASEAKKRRDSATAYREGAREDLAVKEEAELKILAKYLPEQMGEDEIRSIVRATIEKVEATGMKDMGAVMKELMPHVKGKADGGAVNKVVKELLSQ